MSQPTDRTVESIRAAHLRTVEATRAVAAVTLHVGAARIARTDAT